MWVQSSQRHQKSLVSELYRTGRVRALPYGYRVRSVIKKIKFLLRPCKSGDVCVIIQEKGGHHQNEKVCFDCAVRADADWHGVGGKLWNYMGRRRSNLRRCPDLVGGGLYPVHHRHRRNVRFSHRCALGQLSQQHHPGGALRRRDHRGRLRLPGLRQPAQRGLWHQPDFRGQGCLFEL